MWFCCNLFVSVYNQPPADVRLGWLPAARNRQTTIGRTSGVYLCPSAFLLAHEDAWARIWSAARHVPGRRRENQYGREGRRRPRAVPRRLPSLSFPRCAGLPATPTLYSHSTAWMGNGSGSPRRALHHSFTPQRAESVRTIVFSENIRLRSECPRRKAQNPTQPTTNFRQADLQRFIESP